MRPFSDEWSNALPPCGGRLGWGYRPGEGFSRGSGVWETSPTPTTLPHEEGGDVRSVLAFVNSSNSRLTQAPQGRGVWKE